MNPFAFQLPTKIIFGRQAQPVLATELTQLGASRILLVSDTGLEKLGIVSRFQESLQKVGIMTAVFTSVSSNPTTNAVDDTLEIAKAQKVDTLIALGGGSPIDVAKGAALLLSNGGTYADYQWGGKAITKRSWPLIAIPTTAGTGSEVSKVAVVSDPDNPFKKGVLSHLMFPHVAVVDPELTRSLPPLLTAATGMDAFIHALEAYLGLNSNPFSDQFALAAMKLIWQYLPRATFDGDDMQAREQMMLAALWGGIAMDHAGLGLVHALSGPLTTHLHLHHGLANAIILPHVLRFNLPLIPKGRQAALAQIFGVESDEIGEKLADLLAQFIRQLGLPTKISEIEYLPRIIDKSRIAEETMQMVLLKNNPRPVSAADCSDLLELMS